MWHDPSYIHWLRTRDSNSELWVMSPLCYHYTNSRFILVAGTGFEPVTSRLWASQATSAPPRYLFVLGRGVEPLFPGWKPGILTDRWTEQLFFYYQHVKELFYSVVIFNNNTKLIHFFDTAKQTQKKPILLRWVFVRYFFTILSHLHFGSISLCCWCAEYEYGFHWMYYYLISY